MSQRLKKLCDFFFNCFLGWKKIQGRNKVSNKVQLHFNLTEVQTIIVFNINDGIEDYVGKEDITLRMRSSFTQAL